MERNEAIEILKEWKELDRIILEKERSFRNKNIIKNTNSVDNDKK